MYDEKVINCTILFHKVHKSNHEAKEVISCREETSKRVTK